MNADFARLLRNMVDGDASDMYLKVGEFPQLRVHGELISCKRPAVTDETIAAYLAEVLTEPQLRRFDEAPDLDVALVGPNNERYRINCFRQRGHTGMVVRWVRGGSLSLDALGLPRVLGKWSDALSGLVIVAGPTGSGKSTTLSAMIELMNSRTPRRHIVTIEDPIEYVYTDNTCLIEQREVGYDTRSFADALRHVVRQTPDVILIGEMRDLETMKVALSAAMTGHLVLTTLHTTDALGTVERILHYFPPQEQQFVRVELSQSLVGIMCQRLVPNASTGGRLPATEILSATPLVRKHLLEGDTAALAELLHGSRDPEVESFQRALARLVGAGLIAPEAALAHSSDPTELELHLDGMYSGTDSIREARESSSPGLL